MRLRYDISFEWYHLPLQIPLIFAIFMDAKRARHYLNRLHLLMKPVTSGNIIQMLDLNPLTRCLDRDPEMAEIFHRAGAFIGFCAYTISYMVKYHQGVKGIEKHLWLPIRYALGLHTRVIEDGDSSSTVEYDGKKYKVGIEEKKDPDGEKSSLSQYVYRYYNLYYETGRMFNENEESCVFPYESLLLIAATRFIREGSCDNDRKVIVDATRNSVEKLVWDAYWQSYGSRGESECILIAGGRLKGDPIKDFIVYNPHLIPGR